jgi:hypothetical protein
MTKRIPYSLLLFAAMIALAPITRAVDRVVITDASTGAGSLQAAILALNDGDHITFHIPPETGEVHYIMVPPDGWPLITKNNVLIDGFTQGGASPNTASIHSANNAVLKIVLSATNGNALSMYSAVTNFAGFNYPNLGFGDSEMAILGFFKATNAWVRGLCIQSDPHPTTTQNGGPGDAKAFSFAPDAPDISPNGCQNFHVSGCWFGLDPVTKQVKFMPDGTNVATPHMCTATYGTGTNGTPGGPNFTQDASGTFGVAPGSATPRAEFNVCITPYGFDATGGPYHVAGNFWGIQPDGVTGADMSDFAAGNETSDAFCEWGGAHDVVIGTDGDGVNDADEANIFGKYTASDADLEFYGGGQNIVFAGNTFGADINGKSLEPGHDNTLNKLIHKFDYGATTVQWRFGSDFTGVSDSLKGNLVVDSTFFDVSGTPATNLSWISMRGNSITNSTSVSGSSAPLGDGQTTADGLDQYSEFIDVSGGASVINPVITAATTTSLSGTCGLPLHAPYTNLVVDIYQADPVSSIPQGLHWLGTFTDNSPADSNAAVGAFTFNTTGLGITSGTKLTIAVTYTSTVRPTITSVSKAGNQSTVAVSNFGQVKFALQESAAASPTSWSTLFTSYGGTSTFTDNQNPTSFYRTQSIAGGQTSPFSVVFSVP